MRAWLTDGETRPLAGEALRSVTEGGVPCIRRAVGAPHDYTSAHRRLC